MIPPNKKMHDYEKIRRIFLCGMSAIAYYKVVLPEVNDLHRVATDADSIASMMLRRGDLIPPSAPRIDKNTNFNNHSNFPSSSATSSLDVNGNYYDQLSSSYHRSSSPFRWGWGWRWAQTTTNIKFLAQSSSSLLFEESQLDIPILW